MDNEAAIELTQMLKMGIKAEENMTQNIRYMDYIYARDRARIIDIEEMWKVFYYNCIKEREEWLFETKGSALTKEEKRSVEKAVFDEYVKDILDEYIDEV